MQVSVEVERGTGNGGRVGDGARGGARRTSKTLLLLAQFLGLVVREVKVRVAGLAGDSQLVFTLGELRLDTSVIHRTRLSLALYTYQGALGLHQVTTGHCLAEATFAFQASVQALVGAGRVTSVEEVKRRNDLSSFFYLYCSSTVRLGKL